MNEKYQPPLNMWQKLIILNAALLGLILLYFICKLIKMIYLIWEGRRDRSYNVFDREELSGKEKSSMGKWKFDIPQNLANLVTMQVVRDDIDHEIRLTFTEECRQKICCIRSIVSIPPCSRFRYFEVDVIENKDDVPIYVGIIEQKDKFNALPSSFEEMLEGQALFINGFDGSVATKD